MLRLPGLVGFRPIAVVAAFFTAEVSWRLRCTKGQPVYRR